MHYLIKNYLENIESNNLFKKREILIDFFANWSLGGKKLVKNDQTNFLFNLNNKKFFLIEVDRNSNFSNMEKDKMHIKSFFWLGLIEDLWYSIPTISSLGKMPLYYELEQVLYNFINHSFLNAVNKYDAENILLALPLWITYKSSFDVDKMKLFKKQFKQFETFLQIWFTGWIKKNNFQHNLKNIYLIMSLSLDSKPIIIKLINNKISNIDEKWNKIAYNLKSKNIFDI